MSVFPVRHCIRLAVLTGLFVVSSCLQSRADLLTVETDTTWQVLASAPATGWNTILDFAEDGFTNAFQNRIQSVNGYNVPGLWHPSGSPEAWFRKVFTIDGSPGTGILNVVIDDDMEFYINGNLIIQDSDHFVNFFYNMDVLSSLKLGQNLIAVHTLNRVNTIGLADRTLAVKMDVNTVIIPGAIIAGKVTMEGLVTSASVQNITFVFRPVEGGSDIIRVVSVPPTGEFRVSGLPRNAYTLHIKGDKNLAADVSVDVTNGDVSGVTAFLPAGDTNNDNLVDLADFGVLVNSFGSIADQPTSGYDARADFNGDGMVDVVDFGLLVNNYGFDGDR